MSATRTPINPLVKLALEAGPLAVFFIANNRFDIFTATAAFMVAITVALVGNWILERRLPVMPLVTAGFVLVFGGLTLVLHDDLFIKLKPTIVNLLFATALFVGLYLKRPLLRYVFEAAFRLDDAGWRILTIRWAWFFVALAVLNEVVWRNFTTDTWVSFKTFGIMPITIVFTLSQLPLINRHTLPEEKPAE